MLLFALGIGAAVTFRYLHIANPYFLGPLAASATITCLGADLSPLHPVILSAAQIVLGTWLGSNFQRSLFARAGRLTGAVIGSGLLFLLLSVVCALALAWTLGLPWEELVLGAAPGGVNEMALTAKFLNQDVALITAFHITRIFVIVPNIPWVVSYLYRRRKRDLH